MPLYDSLGKKATKPEAPKQASRTSHLAHPPSVDDLRRSMLSAQECMRQPIMLTWKRDPSQPTQVLTVIRNSEAFDPTWMLQVDEHNEMKFVWTYTTTDPDLIYNLITEQVLESGPAAVIPESLRPKTKEELEAEQREKERKEAEEKEAAQLTIFEHYEIMDTIGQGGMGVIYKARDTNDGDIVALKVLRADLLMDRANIERFKHEANAARKLAHPNLISVKEFGFSRYGQPYLTMDFLDGVELQHVLTQQRSIDLPAFVNIFTQICDGLAYAHDKGVVHRDLKPGNIMIVKNQLGGQDTVKIIDFGIAKTAGEGGGQSITTVGGFVGSPAYMSPEQCGGAVLDSRSDIYSMGCVMYQSISGVSPFKYDNVVKTIMAHVNEPAPKFEQVRPDLHVPEELKRIIFKSLEKNPDDRYQTARELSEDLWAFAAMGYSTAGAEVGDEPAPEPVPEVPAGQKKKRIRRRMEQNSLSDISYTLLRWSGVISNNTLKALTHVEGMLNAGRITIEQAIEIVKAAQQAPDLPEEDQAEEEEQS